MMLVPVRLMDLPEESDVEPRVLALASRLSTLFSQVPSSANDGVGEWLRGKPVKRGDTGPFHADELSHELSEWMAPFASQVSDDGRTLAEIRVLRCGVVPTVDDVLAGGSHQFRQTLVQLHARLDPDSAGFRSAPVASLPDKKGVGVLYVAPEYIPDRLEAIFGHWSKYVDRHPGLAATVAMTALMNLHPFMDGNGRVARIVFHWTLNRHRGMPVYLPIQELSALSRCGYLIRLRQAQYHGEWGPLLDFLVMVSERLTSFVATRSTARPPYEPASKISGVQDDSDVQIRVETSV